MSVNLSTFVKNKIEMAIRKRKILLIYTGGTIGMITDPATGVLKPFNFEQITKEVPELNKLDCEIKTFSFDQPIDSSNMTPEVWIQLAGIISSNYVYFDGFVVLHGSDTMAYTASALSFMIKNLDKPIVFTGSQLPIGIIRTDGKENLITAIEVAAACDDNERPLVPEVSVYFEYKLYRANRTTKLSADHFNAFASFNYPMLAEAGITIDYNLSVIQKPTHLPVEFITEIDTNVGVLKVFPGISPAYVQHFFKTPNLRGVILETFGAGNASSSPLFLSAIKQALQEGIVIVNVTQCKSGKVNQQKYETGRGLEEAGVIGGNDITFEAALTKMMVLLGMFKDGNDVKHFFNHSWSGEITV
jgi:L-asparaginase